MADKALDNAAIRSLLSETKGRQKADPTEPRDVTVWFKLNHRIREDGCENTDCCDPRPKSDGGTNIVAEVKGQFICRYCFLAGYLSTAKEVNSGS